MLCRLDDDARTQNKFLLMIDFSLSLCVCMCVRACAMYVILVILVDVTSFYRNPECVCECVCADV